MEYLPEAESNCSYVNESERNVHIWCSLVKSCTYKKFAGKSTLGLVAGCYVHNWLPVSVFYKWLHVILDLSAKEKGNMALFPCPDPRKQAHRIGAIGVPNQKPLSKQSTDNMEAGHYMLFRYDPTKNSFFSAWPTLTPTNFKRRTRSASQTCTPSPNSSSTQSRDTQTRIDVRMRDKRCLVTGQAAVGRARGGNFTGFEVAHIFPLMAVENTDWTDLMPPAARQQVCTRQVADRPHNAILLRADIHSLFDDYQWSIWVEQGKPRRIVRFEKSGAAVLEQNESVDFSPTSLSTAVPPSMPLLMEHLRVALLIHVRGVGKRAVAGFSATVF